MKSKSIITGLVTALALVCANLSLAATSFPDDLATFSCEIKPLTQDGLQTALANRERFAKACLACIEDNCAMRIWPAGYEDQETLCRNTYCLPKKVRKMTFAEGYNMIYRYRYQVGADGKTTILGGEYLEGEPRGGAPVRKPVKSTEHCWKNWFRALSTRPSSSTDALGH